MSKRRAVCQALSLADFNGAFPASLFVYRDARENKTLSMTQASRLPSAHQHITFSPVAITKFELAKNLFYKHEDPPLFGLP